MGKRGHGVGAGTHSCGGYPNMLTTFAVHPTTVNPVKRFTVGRNGKMFNFPPDRKLGNEPL
jgi:hypothetical protein